MNDKFNKFDKSLNKRKGFLLNLVTFGREEQQDIIFLTDKLAGNFFCEGKLVNAFQIIRVTFVHH